MRQSTCSLSSTNYSTKSLKIMNSFRPLWKSEYIYPTTFDFHCRETGYLRCYVRVSQVDDFMQKLYKLFLQVKSEGIVQVLLLAAAEFAILIKAFNLAFKANLS